MRKSVSGFEALVEAAVLAGCRDVCGFRTTTADEIARAAAVWMPRVGGRVHQPENEQGALEMAYKAALEGTRVLLSSSGISTRVMREGLAHLAAAEFPCVIAHTMRRTRGSTGPGLGDYIHLGRVGGYTCYRSIVLAPNSVDEVVHLTIQAFALADRYHNPVVLLTDEPVGELIESVEFPEVRPRWLENPRTEPVGGRMRRSMPPWCSSYQDPVVDSRLMRFQEKYRDIEDRACAWKEYRADDANTLLVAYGMISRSVQDAVNQARRSGFSAGMFRPISLYPFPARRLGELTDVSSILVVELGRGQLLESVQESVSSRTLLHHMSASEGTPPKPEDLLAVIRRVGLRHAACGRV